MIASASIEGSPVLARLEAADVGRSGSRWRSLDPRLGHARSLLEVARAVLPAGVDAPAAEALGEALVRIAAAMHDAFPHNLFGDLDFLAASLWRGAHEADGGPVGYLREQGGRIAALQGLFGRGTAIRFRYVHDFLYGFDWAKWVARDPEARAGVRPFGPRFLLSMEARGHELLALIAEGRDRKYPPLPDARARNPFGFSREPGAEVVLHQRLAAEGLLPVEAWRSDARPVWNRPFAELRRQRAVEMGLGV